MKRALTALLAGVLLAAHAAPAGAAAPTGRLLVMLEPAPRTAGPVARAAAARAFVARAAVRPSGFAVPEIGLVTVRPRDGEGLAALARRLRSDPAVASVQQEGRFTPRHVPNDPAFTTPESSPGTPPDTAVEWWAEREGLFAAWDISRGAGALVGVIDSGIDGGHPELAGSIASATKFDADPASGPATVDEFGHGTHVASLACAAGDNGVGLAGAGLGCRLVVEKSDLTDSSVAAAIVDAVKRGAQAINMSFGDDGRRPAAQAIRSAIDYAYAHDVVLVAAAADDPVEEQGVPANVLQPTGTGPQLDSGKGLTVTAAQFDDRRASFAGRGTQVSIAAYGAFSSSSSDGPPGIFGAFPGRRTDLERGSLLPLRPPCGCRVTFAGDSRYAYLQGTSMAAPQVTAVAALLRNLNPALRAADVIRILKQVARRPAGTGWTADLGWGILDGGAALDAARRIDRTPPASRVISPRRVRAREWTLRIKGHDVKVPGVRRSGIARYEVYRAKGSAPARLIARTTKTSMRFRGRPASVYRFFTIAIDRDGNRQPRPPRAEWTVTRVLGPAKASRTPARR